MDIDTGWAESNDISFAIEEMVSAGVAAVHFEDQIDAKRCGHRPNKRLVSIQEMNERIESALLGKGTSEIFLIARTDALASEGLDGCIERGSKAMRELEQKLYFLRPLQKLINILF